MPNTFTFRRAPAGLATVLVAIGLLAAAGAAGAQASTTEYAIVHNSFGSVVARRAATGSAVTTSAGVLFDTATGKSTPLPAGNKVTPLYVVSNGAKLRLKDLTSTKAPLYLHCTGNKLPTVDLRPPAANSVVKAQMERWNCSPGGV